MYYCIKCLIERYDNAFSEFPTSVGMCSNCGAYNKVYRVDIKSMELKPKASNTSALLKGDGLPIFIHFCNLLSMQGINVNNITNVKLKGNELSFQANGHTSRITLVQCESEVQHG